MPVSKNYETDVRTLAGATGRAKLVIKSMIAHKDKRQVTFPAFLTSFSQTFTSNWNEEEVYGRMDPIATFQNTRRSISLAFDLPSANISVAKDNLISCEKLAGFLYPGYLEQKDIELQSGQERVVGNVISRPPLVSVKFANLIAAGSGAQLGYLSGLEWAPVLDMGMYADGTNFYPKVISLSFTLLVLHQGDKGFDEKGSWLSSPLFGGVGKPLTFVPPKEKKNK